MKRIHKTPRAWHHAVEKEIQDRPRGEIHQLLHKRRRPKTGPKITDFTAPTNLIDLRSLMGLVNRFTDSSPDLKQITAPWRTSLKKAKVFVWGPVHDKALEEVKAVIKNPYGPVLKYFHPALPIHLLTDASHRPRILSGTVNEP